MYNTYLCMENKYGMNDTYEFMYSLSYSSNSLIHMDMMYDTLLFLILHNRLSYYAWSNFHPLFYPFFF